MRYFTEERSFETRTGLNWDWLSRSGKRVGFRVTRMARIEGRGAVLGITTYEDPDTAPRLQIYLSDGGKSLRVWLGDKEMQVGDQ